MPKDIPISDKKLRRMMRKLEKKGEKYSADDVLPKEYQKPPKHLKGRERGMWYKERQKIKQQIKQLDISQPIIKDTAKSRKREKKALRKSERKKVQEELHQCLRIGFDETRKNMISDYLDSVADKTPTFLIPQNEYHKTLTRNTVLMDEECDVDNSTAHNVDPESVDLDTALLRVHELSENFPYDISEGVSLHQINAFLENKQNENCGEQSQNVKSPCRKAKGKSFAANKDEGSFESMDKYKHLEDTQFKSNFFKVLSSNIETNLQKALMHTELHRNTTMDKELYQSYLKKKNNPKFQTMMKCRQRLPSYEMQKAILDLINKNQVVLISGETGCGKTTQVAQFILDYAIQNRDGSLCNIVCTQPRRISAISVAQRVSVERLEEVGRESVGYQIRLERKVGRKRGAILYCTTGILLQFMQSDPALGRYSHIILDEIHERDSLCDFALTILRDIALKRSDLKIVLMSATLNAHQFSAYFNNCPSINIPGYTYPVKELYLEDVLLATKHTYDAGNRRRQEEGDDSFKKYVTPYAMSLKKKYPDFVIEGLCNPASERINATLIIELMKHICTNLGPGAILVFVPGWEDISAIVKMIASCSDFFKESQYAIFPLHSMLSTANQQSIFERPPPGQRKIVVATNIAETSITIDDVVFVIDCGKIKIKNYDVSRNISTLKPEFVSLANARQRRGRAGRVQSGYCFHLYSRGRERALADYPLPEMLRTRLEEVILSIKLLQLGKSTPFLKKVMDPPDPRAVSLSLELLIQLNALDEFENLTPLGYHLAKLPLDPQIGKMLLMGVTMSCLNPILSIAATLSFKDPFYVPLNENPSSMKTRKFELDKGNKSDHLIMASVIDEWEKQEKRGQGKTFCNTNFLVRGTLFQLRDQKSLFTQYLWEMGFLKDTNYREKNLNKNSDNIALVKAVICSGLYPNVAIIKSPKPDGRKNCAVRMKTSEDGKVTLHSKSVNNLQADFESKFMVYHEKLLCSCLFIYDTTMVSSLPLLIFSHNFYLTYVKKKAIIHLNKDVEFMCDKQTAKYIIELKLRMNWLLEYKLSHPGQVMWKDDSSSEIGLLKVLTGLFTSENDQLMGGKSDSSDG